MATLRIVCEKLENVLGSKKKKTEKVSLSLSEWHRRDSYPEFCVSSVYCCVYCLLLCAPCRPSPRSRPRPRWTTSRRCTTSTTARRSSCSATTPRAPASGSRYVELNFRCCRSNIQKKSYFFTALYRICHWGWVITVYCTFWLPLYWSWSWSSCYSLFLALAILRQASPVLMLEHLIFRVLELSSFESPLTALVGSISLSPTAKEWSASFPARVPVDHHCTQTLSAFSKLPRNSPQKACVPQRKTFYVRVAGSRPVIFASLASLTCLNPNHRFHSRSFFLPTSVFRFLNRLLRLGLSDWAEWLRKSWPDLGSVTLGLHESGCKFAPSSPVPWSLPGCRTENGEKLSCSQAEPGQAIKSAVA